MALTRAQVAERLGINEAAVRRAQMKHDLPGQQIEGTWLFEEQDVEEYETRLREAAARKASEARAPFGHPVPSHSPPSVGVRLLGAGPPSLGFGLGSRGYGYEGARRTTDEASLRARILAWLELGAPELVELRHHKTSDLLATSAIREARAPAVAAVLAQGALDDVQGRGGRHAYRLSSDAEGHSPLVLSLAADQVGESEGAPSHGGPVVQALTLLQERTQGQLLQHVEHSRTLEQQSRRLDQDSYRLAVSGHEKTIAILEGQLDKALQRVAHLEGRGEEIARLREEALNDQTTRTILVGESNAAELRKTQAMGAFLTLAPALASKFLPGNLPPIGSDIRLVMLQKFMQSMSEQQNEQLFRILRPDQIIALQEIVMRLAPDEPEQKPEPKAAGTS